MNARACWTVAVAATLTGIVGLDAAVASNGGAFRLGRTNHETRPTTLINDGTGSAISFQPSSPTTPPFRVSNGILVPGLNADRLDGYSAEDLQRRITGTCPSPTVISGLARNGTVSCTGALQPAPRHVVVVHDTGGTQADQLELTHALQATIGASPSDPWQIFLEPGVYDLDTLSLPLLPYVDFVGAGREAVTLRGSGTSLIRLQSGSTLAHLNLQLTVASGISQAVSVEQATAAGLIDLHISVIEDPGPALSIAVRANDSTLLLSEVTIDGTGDEGVHLQATTGSYARIIGSRIGGSVRSVSVANHSTAAVANSQMDNDSLVFTGGAIMCVGTWNSAFVVVRRLSRRGRTRPRGSRPSRGSSARGSSGR